jgi:hypothetical protein
MASLALTASAQQVSLEPGMPVYFTNTNGSAATVSVGFTAVGAAASPPIVVALAATTGTAIWTWPGIFINYGVLSLWLLASVATGVTLFYPT